MLRQWPPFPKTIVAEDAIRPLFKICSKKSGTVAERAALYEELGGYDIGENSKTTCRDPMTELSEPPKGVGRMWDRILARALLVAFQLGVEQGRRLYGRREDDE